MGHAEASDRGMSDYSRFNRLNPDANLADVRMDERNAMHWENRVRSQYGIPLREFYTKDATNNGYLPALQHGTTINMSGYDYSQNDPCIVCILRAIIPFIP
jgi:hypothetical protein